MEDELEIAKKAGDYLQLFARTNCADWAQLMRGVNPNQGYGRSEEVCKAYDIARGLYDWADTHWLNSQVPNHYASAADLGNMLINSNKLLDHWSQELNAAWDSSQKRNLHLETIPMVHSAVEKAQHGVGEALRQLKPVLNPPSANTPSDILDHAKHLAECWRA